MKAASFHIRMIAISVISALAATSARCDVVISNDPTQNMTCSGGLCSPTDNSAVLNIGDLTNLLATGDVTVTSNIHHKQDAKNIDLLAPLTWSNSSRLTLAAKYNLSIEAAVTVAGAGGLTLWSRCLACLMKNATITFQNPSSSLEINGRTFTLVQDLPTLVSDIAGQKAGYYALANDYDARNDQFSRAPIPAFYGLLHGLGHSISNLTLTSASKKCAGFISSNRGTVYYLHLTALSVSTPQGDVGGMAGCNQGLLYYVSVEGTISGSGNVGGIAGTNGGTINWSRAAVSVTGNQAGGIAGMNSNNIGQSFAIGSVTGSSNTGGLIGSSTGTVTDSYAMASVSGNGGAAGGLVGFDNGPLERAYSTGPVTGGTGFTGGFVGYDPNEQIFTSYWDTEASGLSNGSGFPASDPGMIGLTTAQFQAQRPKGFEKKVWGQDPGINNGYPYLRANPPN